MVSRQATESHNYLPKMVKASIELQASGLASTEELNHMYIKHDDWCDALNGVGFCNCDPDIVFKGETVG